MLKAQLTLENLYFIPGKIGHNELSFYEKKMTSCFWLLMLKAQSTPKNFNLLQLSKNTIYLVHKAFRSLPH